MRDAIGIGAIVFIGVVLYLISIPGYETADYGSFCTESKPIIIDGEFAACTGDEMVSANYTWMPPGGPAPLQEIKIPDDRWIDGP